MEKFTIGQNPREVVTAANMNQFVDAVNKLKNYPQQKKGEDSVAPAEGEIRIVLPEAAARFTVLDLNQFQIFDGDFYLQENAAMPLFVKSSSAAESPAGAVPAVLQQNGRAGDVVSAKIFGISFCWVSFVLDIPFAAYDGGKFLKGSAAGNIRIIQKIQTAKKAAPEDCSFCLVSIGGGAVNNWGSFLVSPAEEGDFLKVSGGYVSRNGIIEYINGTEKVEAKNGLLCLKIKKKRQEAGWEDPVFVYETPQDDTCYPIAQISLKKADGDHQIQIRQYPVSVAVFLATKVCPIIHQNGG